MDFLDFLWQVNQERQIGDLRGRLDQMRVEHDLAGAGPQPVQALAARTWS